MTLSGNSDPDPRYGGDSGLVPADPREAAGSEHHGSGLQQHRRHAGRVLPCLQDRVLSWACHLLSSPNYPPAPRPKANVVALRFIKACCSLMVWKSFAALDAFDSVAETKVRTLLYVCDTSTLSTDSNVCFLPLGNNINLNNINQSSTTYLTAN